WLAFEEVAAELSAAAARESQQGASVRDAVHPLAAQLTEASSFLLDVSSHAKSEACLNGIGLALLTTSAATTCWTFNGATGGLATVGCIGLTVGAFAAAVDIANVCGGSRPFDLDCDCRNPPDCRRRP
ncbi:MAG: hypothetical protein AAF420_10675, partial [Pseudomonadota bacterium]